MHFEDCLNSIKEYNEDFTSKNVKKMEELDKEILTSKRNLETLLKDSIKNKGNNSLYSDKFDKIKTSKIEKEKAIYSNLVNEKNRISNMSYFELDSTLKKVNDLMENVKRELFYYKIQSFNQKGNTQNSIQLEDFVNKSKIFVKLFNYFFADFFI